MKKNTIEEQIYEKRKEVRYDIRDLTTEFIYKKFEAGLHNHNDRNTNILFIPEYQREFTWDKERQSKLIESIILGLPIPFIFVAENKDSSWEIVDGSQRIRTIHSFISNKLTLIGLQAIPTLNNMRFDDLKDSRQGKILDTALRFIVLSEETTDDVKFDMFERINLGSDLLKSMEKRKGLYTGDFTSFLYRYVKDSEKFNRLTLVDKYLENRQEKNELLLRFFALSYEENYKKDIGSISKFLDDFLQRINKKILNQELSLDEFETKINKVIDFVEEYFPYGFRHAHNPQTKRTVFEAISVGSYLAIMSGKNIIANKDDTLRALQSEEFKEFIYIPSKLHNRKKLFGRINFIYKLLVGREL